MPGSSRIVKCSPELIERCGGQMERNHKIRKFVESILRDEPSWFHQNELSFRISVS